MKERILLVSDGQCGGNIGAQLANMGFISYFINTSNVDLQTLEGISEENKFHIPNSTGCNKDRVKAIKSVANYHKYICNSINRKFATQDIVFFVFSMAGGTGGGISPILLDYLSRNNPNKHYGAIVVLPSNSEPIQALRNAIDCYNELCEIPNLKSVFMLDNNYGNKDTINYKFAELFETLVNIVNPDERGIVDDAELEKLLTCKGFSIMSYIDLVSIASRNAEECLMDRNIFAPMLKSCKYFGVSLKDEVNTEVIEDAVGIPRDTYIGYNSAVNFMVATGMQLDIKRIELMADIYTKKEELRNFNEQVAKTVETSKFNDENPKEKKEDKIDFETLFGKYIG